MTRLALSLLLLSLCGEQARAGFVTVPTDGRYIFFWGPDSTGNQTYGQTFTVTEGDSILTSYTLTVATVENSTSFSFVSQVYAWDGTAVVGPALFTSRVLTTTADNVSHTFSTDIAVTSGQQYVAIVTNQPFGSPMGGSGIGTMQANFSNPYAGGSFVYAVGDPTAPSAWTAVGSIDAQFQATFLPVSPVPEPSSLAMLCVGVTCICTYRLRRSSTGTTVSSSRRSPPRA